MNKRWFRVAVFLVALGIVFYVINLIVFVPRFYIFQQASLDAFHARTTIPNPVDFGIDQNYWITTFFLSAASGVLIMIGGGYLFIQLMIRILRPLV